jgi:excisionase family DNA binding protein
MVDRLLVTKAEAAERLGISVRTIERLVATGQLPIVHVERAARLRVSDLKAYVQDLTEAQPPSDTHPLRAHRGRRPAFGDQRKELA